MKLIGRKETANPNTKFSLMYSMYMHGNIEKEIGQTLMFNHQNSSLDL